MRALGIVMLAGVLAGCGGAHRGFLGLGPTGGSGNPGGSGPDGGLASPPGMVYPPGPPGCGFQQAAFCDTFDTPSAQSRSGVLNEANWSVARLNQNVNPSQCSANEFDPGTLSACFVSTPGVVPDKDIQLCTGNGTPSMHVNQLLDDGGNFAINALRIRQPFDWTNRTGVLAFDVDGKGETPTGHGWWFEVWITDEPVPVPYQNDPGMDPFPRNAVAVVFNEPSCNGGVQDGHYNAPSSIMVVQNYNVVSEATVQSQSCYTTADEVLNHFEIRISQQRVEVWASDAGAPSTFRRVGYADNLNLPLTHGYVNLEQAHYNAPKGGLTSYQTFHWDNVGFDGPVYSTPRAYDMPDATGGGCNPGSVNTGYIVSGDTSPPEHASFSFGPVDLTNAVSASLNLNVWGWSPSDSITYQLNGHPVRNYPYPLPASVPLGTWNTVHIPVALSDLQQGNNTLTLASTTGHDGTVIANIDLTVELP